MSDWTTTPWPHVLEALSARIKEREMSIRQAAREIGVSHGALGKILSGQTGEPYEGTRRMIAVWLAGEKSPAPADATLEDVRWRAARGLLVDPDPDTLRLALQALPGRDDQGRLAIIREFEDWFLEEGVQPKKWPDWFHDLRSLRPRETGADRAPRVGEAPIYVLLRTLAGLEEGPEGPLYGARLAVTVERKLNAQGRLPPQDRELWEAFKEGRGDVSWEDLEPVEISVDHILEAPELTSRRAEPSN